MNNLYQGMTLDAVMELYDDRVRDYSPTLGRWLTRDPIGYQGGINLHGYVDSSPVGNVDAEGLREYHFGPIHYLPDHRFYRNYYYWYYVGQTDLPGSFGPSAGAQFAHAVLGVTSVGALMNSIVNESGLTTAQYTYSITAYWKDTRVYTYKCIENGHPTDIKWQSTTKGKDLRVVVNPVQHWEGEGVNPLDIGPGTTVDEPLNEVRNSLVDLIKELADEVSGS